MITRFLKTNALLILIIFGACGEGDSNTTELTDTTENVIAKEGFVADGVITGEYKRYVGTIDGEPIVLNLLVGSNRTDGEYYYERIGMGINLFESEDAELGKDEIGLTEYFPGNTDEEPARWRVKIQGDSIVGVWENWGGKKVLPIRLKEDYNDEVQRFSIVCITDTTRLIDSMPDPLADLCYTVLIPAGDNEKSAYVRSIIYHSMGCDTVSQNGFAGCLEDKKKEYFTNYRNLQEGAGEDMTMPYQKWSMEVGYNVLYNENDIVVLDNHSYEYTGGAHGNYGSTYLNIDRSGKKLWALNDIMNVDTAVILPLIEKQIRKDFEIGKGQMLSTRLLSDDIYIPSNFYISNKGITFVYGLYEIASYADGMVNVFVPYDKVMNLLRPEFKQRMGLEAIAAN